MKMKRILLFFAFISSFVFSYAQSARQILDRAAATISNKGGIKANFSMSGKYGNVNGNIAIKGNKFNAYTPSSIVWFDGKTQWTYMKRSQEVNVSNPTVAQLQTINPYRFIYIYKNGYVLSSTKTNRGWNVRLVAHNKNQSIKEMYIIVDKNYHLKQVKVRQNSGWISISINNYKKANLPDSQFRFNNREYPNAEVIDLR